MGQREKDRRRSRKPSVRRAKPAPAQQPAPGSAPPAGPAHTAFEAPLAMMASIAKRLAAMDWSDDSPAARAKERVIDRELTRAKQLIARL